MGQNNPRWFGWNFTPQLLLTVLLMVTALTFNDLPHVNAIGSRVTGLFDVLKLLQTLKIDGNGLMQLVGLMNIIGTADTTKEQVVAALEILKIVSAATPNETDDKIVAAVVLVLSGKTLDLMVTLIDSWLGNRTVAMSTFEAEASAAGLDFTTFFELAKLVASIIRARREAKKP